MSSARPGPERYGIHYPESDGRPMADNTVEYELNVLIKGGIDALIPDFVAGAILWYPVQGFPQIVQAPDILVAVGRPKGHRGSYRQWEEGDVAPQVVFEILSPSNTPAEMVRKFVFYQKHGVEEYYVLDPEKAQWVGYRRVGAELVDLLDIDGWTSPLLGIRLGVEDGAAAVWGPDGERFRTFQELADAKAAAVARADREEARAAEAQARADREEARAAEAQAWAGQERMRADQQHARADQEHARADQEHARAEALASKLRALGVEV